MASSPSSLISECVFFRSKRLWTSFEAWSIALRTSWMSTLETISKELSAAICGSSCLDYPLPAFVPGSTSIIRYHCCTEKAVKVFRRTESGLVGCNRFHLCDLGGDLGDPGRFVALAAVRHGREEGRVGFDQDAIERDLCQDVADGL